MDITSITNRRAVTALLALIMLSSVFLYFSAPLPGVSDFWWHMKSGQWIVEHGGLPSEDPFAFTTPAGPGSRKSLVLKGYWLAQVVMYAAYGALGFYGVVVLKASVFALIFFTLWRTLCMKGVEPVLALMLMAPTPLLLAGFDNPRPQIFSFLGVLLVFYCVERGLKALRERGERMPRALLFLPPVMLVWANLHQGFIVSYGMFAIYAAAEIYAFARGRNALGPAALKRFLLILVASVLASLINPNHVVAVTEGFSTVGSQYNKTILENFSLWRYAETIGMMHLAYAYIAVAVVTAGFMAASWRTLRLSHILLYAGFAAAGAISFRFYIFFILMSLAISGDYVAARTRSIAPRLRPVAMALALAAAVMVFTISFRDGNFLNRKPLAASLLPVRAVEFVKGQELPSPIFNPYIWGGYMIWELYPEYRVFSDSRMIDFDVYRLYRRALEGDAYILDFYGVNTVILNTKGPRALPLNDNMFLLRSLVEGEQWELVYYDGKAVVFVRAGIAPSVRKLEKSYLKGLFR